MHVVQNSTSISVYNNEGTEFEFHENGDCFRIAPNDTSSSALYFNPNTRVSTYERLQELGKFSDKEITLIRLRVGEIKNWKIDYDAMLEYSKKDIESVTNALKASGLYTMQPEDVERIKSKVMLNTIYGKTTV